MLGRFGGGWKEAGSPLGRLASEAELACWTPGGGAIPGAEDMPGGEPVVYIVSCMYCDAVRREGTSGVCKPYLGLAEEPCQARRLSQGRH